MSDAYTLKFIDEQGMFDYISLRFRQAESHFNTSIRANEAHEYCQKYLMPNAWGKNIWHAILDDAVKMRVELNANKTKE